MRPPLAPGTSWVQFGEETVLLQDEPQEKMPVAKASRGVRMPRREEQVTKDELFVVVQNGRLFQQHNPDVPVLHDRGRFLLVKLDPATARELSDKHETCYGLMPLKEDHVVFESPPLTAARGSSPAIQALVNKIERANFDSSLAKLASFPTRHSTSAAFKDAASWARMQLKDMGYTTRLQTVGVNGGTSRNIIADKKGASSGTRKVVIVTAHLDSINLAGGPAASAPGADDNGSGSAGVMEIARALKDHTGSQDLRLILFGGEEQGLFGSKHYVSGISQAEKKRILAVVNMDMIGVSNNPTHSVLIEGAPLSETVITGLSSAAATYTQLRVETSLTPFASDHVPFINAQVPAVLTIEGADSTNVNIHSEKDTLDKIDSQIAVEILRMNVAFVAEKLM
ncbi:MAG TPA: M28 family metallopeptidase [Pyrinomonadaceae bacterium]|nr:M28 family metallopeptidase [Pyrinomonadaceae bacterium]